MIKDVGEVDIESFDDANIPVNISIIKLLKRR